MQIHMKKIVLITFILLIISGCSFEKSHKVQSFNYSIKYESKNILVDRLIDILKPDNQNSQQIFVGSPILEKYDVAFSGNSLAGQNITLTIPIKISKSSEVIYANNFSSSQYLKISNKHNADEENLRRLQKKLYENIFNSVYRVLISLGF